MSRVFEGRAHGKVNLHLGVGEVRGDGYHDLSTVFMAVDRAETVTLTPLEDVLTADGVVASMSTTFHVREPDEDIDTETNLAWRAVEAVVAAYRARAAEGGSEGVSLPSVRIDVDKTVPVAGGMAGGSADAAAALMAANAYLDHYAEALSHDELLRIGAGLGADVPFCLHGGIALGTARGDELVPMLGRGEYWLVFINPMVGLSTGAVFETLDDMRFDSASLVPYMETGHIARALMTGDPREVGAAMHNDLEAAAVKLMPGLKALSEVAIEEGGVRAMVSGSGPTMAVMCGNQAEAYAVCEKLRANELTSEMEIFVARGPAAGAAAAR